VQSSGTNQSDNNDAMVFQVLCQVFRPTGISHVKYKSIDFPKLNRYEQSHENKQYDRHEPMLISENS
jgi:hypothetical protein